MHQKGADLRNCGFLLSFKGSAEGSAEDSGGSAHEAAKMRNAAWRRAKVARKISENV